MDLIYFVVGLVLGGFAIAFVMKKFVTNTVSESDFIVLEEKYRKQTEELNSLSELLTHKDGEIRILSNQISSLTADYNNKKEDGEQLIAKLEKLEANLVQEQEVLMASKTEKAELMVQKEGLLESYAEAKNKIALYEQKQEELTDKYNLANEERASLKAAKDSLDEKLQSQKKEVEDIRKSFTVEFENMANKILEEKTEKFTSVNKLNMDNLLKPLGENLESFRNKVDEVYSKESKERFSLIEKIKDLENLNSRISKDAQNLTTALKGDSKTQGNWGEMVLETILEKSGLRKGEQYRMEVVLKDENGKNLISEAGNSMRPDAVIEYPDDRKVIVDSKVSLTAFTRYIESDDIDKQKRFLTEHVNSLKKHITELSLKAYDRFDKSLDFVMMFVPTEAAYIAALKQDPELWNFAYAKRIILISPTNLITAKND
jgi:DNA recombination protein RmuC